MAALESDLRVARLVGQRSYGHCKGAALVSFGLYKGSAGETENDGGQEAEVLQGTLDLMI
jgi:hypothetical protein